MGRVGDTWSMLIVIALREGPLRFSELKHSVHGISQRMLMRTLRGLERDGLLTRKVTPTKPPRVDYALTRLGHSLREPIESLGLWAMKHQPRIDRAQRKYDANARDEVRGAA
jgi:DNA-binding HxlR family transcriptional regulator